MGPVEILNSLKSKIQNGRRVTAIFDLDSTLFDVSPRISKILNDFGRRPEFMASHPKEAEILSRVTPNPQDFGVKRTLQRYQFPIPEKLTDQALVRDVVDFWKKEFFSSRYLKYDEPYPGARDFVVALADAGVEIFYLWGRDRPRMLEGSVLSLRTHGFPVVGEGENLVLKPNTDVTDVSFKKSFFEKMEAESTDHHVIFFENEPANIAVASQVAPHMQIIFVDTVHSEKSPLPPDSILRLKAWK